MPHSIDYAFISSLEGGSRLTGYVPAANVSRSGVTIATGFDLGQRNEADLRRLGLAPELIVRLKPYLGLKSIEAKQYLAKHPLVINCGDAGTIHRAVKTEHVRQLELKYMGSHHNQNNVAFSRLPAEAQTVIASVSFQYGINLDIRAPRFWRAVSSQNWEAAMEELRNFGDAYPTRRHREAERLARIVR